MRAHLLTAAALALFAAPAAAGHRRPAADKDIVRTAAEAGRFNTLVTLLVAADLLDALRADGPFVVLAPTDEAFGKLPAGALESLLKPENKDQLKALLLYHVIPNKARFNDGARGAFPFATLSGEKVTVRADRGGLRVNDAKVVTANVPCKNGSVQALDAVLRPPGKSAGKPAGDAIPAVAAKAGTFATLLAALDAADLRDTLAGPGPFTVFAPTDEAFGKLGQDQVAALLKPENRARLAEVLRYHVVPGRVSARDAVAAGEAVTLQGGAVRARIADGRLTINGAGVVKSDVPADNGVVHAIDQVLTPGR